MIQKLLNLHTSRLARYIFIGGFSYLLEVSVLLALAHIFLLSPELSVAFSFWIGLIVSFLLQKYIAFNNRKNDRKTIGAQTLSYGSLVIFNYLFTIAFVSLVHALVGLIAARTIALICTVFWNYYFYKKMFKSTI